MPSSPARTCPWCGSASAAEAITERTRALVAVHLYGRCAEMGALTELARRRGLLLVEDASCAECVMPKPILEEMALGILRRSSPGVTQVVIADPRA